ncbi:MAG: hypothetical protein JNL24_00555 [Bacteroidia bacterium]|nr:hypothetical protein [Bacteroidia bacterium]
MAHPYINWTKTYNLSHVNGSFNIYISSHKSGYFYGAIMYYTQKGAWVEQTEPHFAFKLKQFAGATEEEVYQKCIKWVEKNLPGKYTIMEKEIRTF